jgi:hypothetical protein
LRLNGTVPATIRIGYANYEFVDEVMTLTLAEGPGEAGWLIHFMRAPWEDDSDIHQVVNADQTSADGAVAQWSFDGHELSFEFWPLAAAELGSPLYLTLELALSTEERADLVARLDEILIDVPRSDLS